MHNEINELQKESETVSGGIGIQKYSNSEDAFHFMRGSWGEEACDTASKLIIVDDEIFKDVIKLRAITRACEYLFGEISKEKCYEDLGLSADKVTDYLLDFNFFLYSPKGKCYYASHMDIKDDHANVWDDKQWGYYHELSRLYSFSQIGRDAIKLAEFYIEKYEADDVYDALEMIINDEDLIF